jgi:hypothetical protein
VSLVLLILVSAAGCFEADSPTAPSQPRNEVRVGDVTFTAGRVSLYRDFMPPVLDPGPDGGRPLGGAIEVEAANRGSRPQRFHVAASVYDQAGTRHPVTAVARDMTHLMVGDGSLGPGEVRRFEVVLSGGPYLAVGSRAFVVLQFVRQDGDEGTIRTGDVEVTATH